MMAKALKRLFKNVVHRTAKNPVAWFFYRECGRLSDSLGRIYRRAQSVRQPDRLQTQITPEQLFPDLIVVNGPFKKLRYPSEESVSSAILPKLLGSYESELHPVLVEFSGNGYNTIVDIGCAEGYYAVGFALMFPDAEVYAFDTNSNARQLCAKMAKLNGVADHIHIGDFCNEEVLRSIPLGDRALIMSDCEGYEGSLFNWQLAEFLVNHDVIIETHDFIDIELSVKMRDAFAKTHRIRSIKSVDDIEKAHTYIDRTLEPYCRSERYRILREGRPAIMEWLVMTRYSQRP
jgi:precorrin-6B methylase 2